MNRALAEELTQAVGQSTSGAWRTIAGLKALGVPKALGLTDEEWLKKYLGNYIQLAVAERYDAVIAAKAAGLSNRQIAKTAGVDEKTIRKDLRADSKPRRGQKYKAKARDRKQRADSNPHPLTELAAVAISEEARAAADREAQRQERQNHRDKVKDERPSPPMPAGTYRLLYADPPWRYEHVKTESRAIENQYPTMELEAICALDVPAADNAVLFLWSTSPKLVEALQVMNRWGFTYRTCAVWDKEQIGMGYYFRQQHELLLVGARGGAPPVPEAEWRLPSVIRSKRSEHSTKPTFVYSCLEAMYPKFTKADRVELFSRESRAGWSSWSNEPAA